MATVTPPVSPTIDVGNDIDSLEGVDTWTSVASSGTSFTIDSPIDPLDGGTRLVFHGTFTGFSGNMPVSGTIDSIDIIYIDDTGTVFTASSTWADFTAIDLADFQTWIGLDNADPPDTDMGETGAGAALFTSALFGGNDTITGTEFGDSLFGYAGNDVLISAGVPGGDNYELLFGGAGDDTIRIQGDYGNSSEIDGGDDFDTLEIVGGTLANGFLRTDLSDLLNPTGALDGIEAVTFAASGNSQLLVSVTQIGAGLANETVITGDSHKNVFSILVTATNNLADANDLYDLADVTAPVVPDGGFGFTFANWGADDLLAISVADPNSTGTYRLLGNAMNNAVTGAAGNDQLFGDDGNDVLFGGFGGVNSLGGNDLINGQAGDDTITAFAGAGDTLLGGSGGETAGDTLLVWGAFGGDFSTGALGGFENLRLEQIPGLTPSATLSAVFRSQQIATGFSAALAVTGSSVTDTIRINVDGTTPNVDLHSWTFSGWSTALDEVRIIGDGVANTITGSTMRDYIDGGAGADTLTGGNGDDTFIAGGADGATDHMYGGAGNDLYAINESTDIVHELADEGAVDLVSVTNLTSYTLTANVENLVLYGTAANGTGNELGNTLEGNANVNVLSGLAGNDVIFAGANNDTLQGGAGADELYGEDGIDTATYAASLAGVIVNLGTGATSGGDAQGDTLNSIENVTGSALNDTLVGSSGANALAGGGGNDTLIGGAGADALAGGLGVDTASYAGSASAVVVNLTTGAGAGGDAQGDTLGAIENLIGSGFNDTLTGSTAANALTGGSGNDTLIGGAGADALAGSLGTDTASYASSSAGVVVNLATGAGAGGDAQGDTLASVENLIGSGFNDTLTGTSAANALTGGSGNDTLIGGAGADALAGSLGTDTASYASSSAGVAVNLTTGAGAGGDAQGDTLASIESLIGSGFNDTLTGTSAANTLSGGAGNDTLIGAGGADALAGGLGVDTASYASSAAAVTVNLTAGTGSGGDAQGDTLGAIENLIGSALNDTLIGSTAANALSGGGGIDTINGMTGADTLTGGGGADNFVFNTALGASNIDTITDFGAIDFIHLENAVFGTLAAGALAGTAFFIGASAADASDRIIYNAATGALYYDADGLGGVAQVQFATLATGLALNAGDFLVI